MASMDFFGFSFNGHHSSELGIVRVSDGSRYNDTILPSFQDKTIAVPGGDGTYFFGSNYTNRPFTVSIAFDGLTEAQFRKLRQVFNGKDVGDLIFDEAPYKAYIVKVQSPPQLKYICFDEESVNSTTSSVGYINSNGNIVYNDREVTNLQRLYKGEGTIQFIGYNTYAHSVYKYLNSYTDTNKNEWATASGMLATKGDYDDISGSTIKLYNPGDVEADFCVYVPIYSMGNTDNLGFLSLSSDLEGHNIIGQLTFNNSSFSSSVDNMIRINSKTNLVEGCIFDYILTQEDFKPEKVYYEFDSENEIFVKTNDSSRINNKNYYERTYELTGTLYNQYITGGDFFKIPLGTSYLKRNATSGNLNYLDLDYSYLYY